MSPLVWHQFKLFVAHASGISMDAWHILLGTTLFLLAAWLFRRSIAHPLPWVVVIVLETANEAYDLLVEAWPDPGSQFGEGVKDMLLTLALPTLLMLFARLRPELLSGLRTAESD